MSPEDAETVGVRTTVDQAYNRDGVVVARAVVSHRMPAGACTCTTRGPHQWDVPRTETSGLRGGIHNFLTRLMIKATHIVGGYTRQAFAFDYLGPTATSATRSP